MRMLCVWDFLIKHVKFKQEKKEKHNFNRKPFVFHETKRWTVCDVNCKPFDKCQKILSLNMSNMKKLKKHNFNQSLHNSGGENMVNFYFNIYLTLKNHNLVGIWNVN